MIPLHSESVKYSVMSDSLQPLECSPPDASVHGVLQQELWGGLPFPSPENLPDTGVKPPSPALQVNSLQSEPLGKSHSAFDAG